MNTQRKNKRNYRRKEKTKGNKKKQEKILLL